VVDAAMIDGVTHMLSAIHSARNAGAWVDRRGSNLLDGGAPFYGVYGTSDGRYLAVGAIEPEFFRQLVEKTGITFALGDQHDRSRWEHLRELLTNAFAADSLDHWTQRFEGVDACVTPVLTLSESLDDPHMAARGTMIKSRGQVQPNRAPRFSNHPAFVPGPTPPVGEDSGTSPR
jgi:alpha-methylacyl-CoA racemase